VSVKNFSVLSDPVHTPVPGVCLQAYQLKIITIFILAEHLAFD
jgi:hypothetical protein